MAKLDRIWSVQISLGTLAIAERGFNDILILWPDEDGFLSGPGGSPTGDRVAVVTGPDELLDLGILDSDPVYTAASNAFAQTPHIRQVYIGWQDTNSNPGPAETVTEALAACATEAPGYWYGLALVSRGESDVKEAAEWAEANERLFGTSSDDTDIPSSGNGDIASFMQGKNYLRTFVCYTKNASSEYPEVALMAERFTRYPGQNSFSNVQLSGITSDNLTETQYLYCKDKNVTTFENFRNFAITQGGKVAGNEWIDVIRLRDQLVESLKVSIVGALIRATNSTGKIPYTDAGIQIIANAMRQPLDLNVARGGLAPEELDANDNVIPSYTISVPRASDVPDNDKANRVLKDCNFTARLAGAIHTGELKGSLVYSF